jgi:hypothetical protein
MNYEDMYKEYAQKYREAMDALAMLGFNDPEKIRELAATRWQWVEKFPEGVVSRHYYVVNRQESVKFHTLSALEEWLIDHKNVSVELVTETKVYTPYVLETEE